ncbi:transposase DDE domain group 1 family protein [Mycobacterium xenopi 4042]|uniref:Transposase DDE domain group 1 family protein n=1 Tax=Mycobacterium xenopi 4042 TaxID=1299334 RepID=X7ZBJ8_MYCXE|nr:transposase DDE domain group 1 family protein [Mycobacterium xenopi 4042]
MHSSYTFTTGSAVFDEQNLLSAAGLVPVLELAEQTGLSELINERVDLPSTRVKSGAVNPAGKLTSIVAGMMCGADSIDDANVLRAAAHPGVQRGICPIDVGDLFARVHLRAYQTTRRSGPRASDRTGGAHPAAGWRRRADVFGHRLAAAPVYGHAKQGASFGHAKIASRALLRLGLSPQITTISTATAAPVIAEAQLRSGKAASGRGAAYQLKQAITTAKAINPDAPILVRGDSMFGTKKVITTCIQRGAEFSLSISRNKRINAAIAAIDEAAWTPVHYPGAVEDPDTGR